VDERFAFTDEMLGRRINTLSPVTGKMGKVVALTFDDGPSAYTDEVLKVLKSRGVRATFFVLGDQVEYGSKELKALVDAGMSVQVHGMHHNDLTKMSDPQIRADVRRAKAALKPFGVNPTCVRPPYGATNKRVSRVLGDAGMHQVLWDVDSRDWTRPGSKKIRGTVLNTTVPGSIILHHDGGGNREQTVAAIRGEIDALKKQGYTFVTPC